MTKATNADRSRRLSPGRTGVVPLAIGVLLATLSGCTADGNNILLTQFVPPWQVDKPDVKPFPKPSNREEMIQRTSDGSYWHPRQQDLAAAKQLIEKKEFPEGEKAFHVISSDKKCPEQIREEALYFEAECQRLQKHYRAAEETYSLLFKEHPSTQFTERADRALFEIALWWLRDTRKQMEEYDEQQKGNRWFVMPASFIHFGQDMPVFDVEGHAVRVLEGIQMREKAMRTDLGEQTLLYLGTLRFYHEDYLDADRHFTDLYQTYPNSKNAAKALKQSIICKQWCTGGTSYDLRTVEESRKLIHTAQTAYPEFGKDTEWIQKQLVGINLQQADRDWRVAEHYRWTKHPGPAYFYYELVRRCYPNTEYATKATARIAELEKSHPEAIRPAQAGTLPEGGVPRRDAPAGAGPALVPGSMAPRTLPPSLAPPQ